MKQLYVIVLTTPLFAGCVPSKTKLENHFIKEEYDDGSIKTEIFITQGTEENPLHYRAISYYPNGQKEIIFSVRNNLRQGLSEYWYPNGQLKYRINFANDSLDGECVFYYESGSVKQKAYYKSGNLHGESIDYYDKEKKILSKGDFKNGEGYITYFYPNGIKHKEGTIKNNKESEGWRYYYENGALQSEGNFKNGKMDGPYKVYDTDGTIIEEGIYKDGFKFYSTEYVR